MQAKRLTILVGEADQWHHRPLYLAILEELKAAGCAGATVTSGIAGFGAHAHIKTRGLLELSVDMPIVVTSIDSVERIQAVLPRIMAMMAGGLVTQEDVEVVYASPAFKGGIPDLSVSVAMSLEPESVAPDASLAEVVERLVDRDYTELPVVDGDGRLIGVIGDEDLVAAGATTASLSLERAAGVELIRDHLAAIKHDAGSVRAIMRPRPLTVQPITPLREAAHLMHVHGVRRLYVVESNDRLVGVVSRLDIFRRIVSGYTRRTASVEYRLPLEHRTAGEIMERSFPTITGDAPLFQVVELLAAADVKRVLVVDGEGALAGIITDADILRRVAAADKPGLLTLLRRRFSKDAQEKMRRAYGQRAADVMTHPVVAVRADSPVIEALTTSVERRIKRVPVLDERGRPIGIVSRPALLAAALDLATLAAER
jgi:CBS domain-containing protein